MEKSCWVTIFLTCDLTCYIPEWLATWLGLATKYLRLDLYLWQNTCDSTWTWSKWLATFFKSHNYVNISRIEIAPQSNWAQGPALNMNVTTSMNKTSIQNACSSAPLCMLTRHCVDSVVMIIQLQFDLSYPAMSGPALIRIRDLAGYGRLNV